MKLSIVIPVFNEEKTVALVLEKLLDIHIREIEKEIIIVDDGSKDSTLSKIKKVIERVQTLKKRKKFSIKLVQHKKNLGKGASVRHGIGVASGDYILIQDADLEYNPMDIERLLEPVIFGKTQVVYGTRLKRLPNFSKDERTLRFFVHYVGNKFLSLLTSLLYGQRITDMETGYKLFSKKSLKGITLYARSFDFEPEITAKLLKSGNHILEIPIKTNPRGYNEGKKLNTVKDGILALWTLLKYRFAD